MLLFVVFVAVVDVHVAVVCLCFFVSSCVDVVHTVGVVYGCCG